MRTLDQVSWMEEWRGGFGVVTKRKFIVAALVASLLWFTPNNSMAQGPKQSSKPAEVASVSVKSNHEISQEEQRLLEEAWRKTMDFLNRNAPAYAKNHQVLVVTTMWAMERVSKWKKIDSFFDLLKDSLDEKTLDLAIFRLFQKHTPWFLAHVSIDGFPKDVYYNLVVLKNRDDSKAELAQAKWELAQQERVISFFKASLWKPN